MQNIEYDTKPYLLSAFDAKYPKKATIIIATPVKIRTYGRNSGSVSAT